LNVGDASLSFSKNEKEVGGCDAPRGSPSVFLGFAWSRDGGLSPFRQHWQHCTEYILLY